MAVSQQDGDPEAETGFEPQTGQGVPDLAKVSRKCGSEAEFRQEIRTLCESRLRISALFELLPMDQRRQLTFIFVSTVFFLIWLNVAPLLFPQFFPKPKPKNPAGAEQAGVEAEQIDVSPDAHSLEPTPEDAAAPQPEVKVAEFPHQEIVIGQGGMEKGYLLEVQLTSKGGAVNWAKLTDPQYQSLDRTDQIKIVGNPVTRNVGQGDVPKTFDTELSVIDETLKPLGASLSSLDWELVSKSEDSATFRYPSPQGNLEILKTFRVPQADLQKRGEDSAGYMLELEVVLRNTSDQTLATDYTLYGPVGLPLENVENTLNFREINLGTLEDRTDPRDVSAVSLDARTLLKQYDKSVQRENAPIDDWRDPLRFAGMSVQFFAALVYPQGDQLQDANGDGEVEPYFEVVRPVVLEKTAKPERSDFTIAMQSPELSIPAGGEVKQSFKTFLGPKRPALLKQIDAESIMQFGWFGGIAKLMLWILEFFHHSLGLPYAFAIILLTVCVRGAMFPISKKQAIEAEKMRILAPELKKIQEKHKDKPEEFARAYREFQKKHNYHPMVGCLPALLQLPIFIGLYRSLYNAIDLRLAKFLWIDNLAAPDSLMKFGFEIPWPFHWTELNLLPILTVILFVLQQKLTVPPATSEEQEMQYRIMNVMTIAIGFAFYRVPAGLCLYFIASSIWGVTERWILKKNPHTKEEALEDMGEPPPPPSSSAQSTTAEEPKPSRAGGWFDKLREAADQAKNATEGQNTGRKFSKQKNKPRR